MASGNDARFAVAKETTYATRVPPTRFLNGLTGESVAFTQNKAYSAALGQGPWQQPGIPTTRGGSGSFTGEVPTAGFGFLIDALHSNVVAPVQVGATTAYLQTHTLDTAPSKTYSLQKQLPPVLTSTLLPVDYTGVMFTSLTVNWSAGGLVTFEMAGVVNERLTGQTLVTYAAPPAWSPFGFQGGSVTVGGTLEQNLNGDGSVTIEWPMRTDSFSLGTGGTMAKPVPTDKPSATASWTADFNDLTNITRVSANTNADLVFRFEGATIAASNKYFFEVTLPDCSFESPDPTVGGPGPVQQSISARAASTTADPPVVKYQSTDVAL
jgi:hypothetical protein